MPPRSQFYAAPFLALLWGIIIVAIPSSVSTPWTPPAAFQSGAHWRVLVGPRKTKYQRADDANIGLIGACTSTSSKSNDMICAGRSISTSSSLSSSNDDNAANSIFDRIS